MPEQISTNIDAIVQTLLLISDRVFEVSQDLVITRAWGKTGVAHANSIDRYSGLKVNEITDHTILPPCTDRLEEGFRTRLNSYREYKVAGDVNTFVLAVRVLMNHQDQDSLFLTIEQLEMNKRADPANDRWKLALDAAGDGIWDINLENGKIYFSDKWYDTFGYEKGEITLASHWYEKVHPDDFEKARLNFDKYVAGETSSYSTEIRYKCKDGKYKWMLSRGIVSRKSPDGKPLRFMGTHTDISILKLMEEEHRSNAELLTKLIDNLDMALLVTDEHNQGIFANQAFCDLYEIAEPPGALKGADMKNSLEKQKHLYKRPDLLVARINEILAQRQKVNNEELEMADGRILSRSYIPLSDNENYKSEIWTFRDITERKNADRRYKEQRLFYERILNAIPADIAVHDAHQNFLFLNHHAIKDDDLRNWLLGKANEDYCRYRNKPMSIAERRRAQVDAAVKARRMTLWEERNEGTDGTITYQLRYILPVFKEDAALDIIIVYSANITDRKHSEDALKMSRDTFANSFNNSGIGKALITPDGKWMEVNDAICKLTGYTKDELNELSYREITYPDDIDIDLEHLKKLNKREIATYTLEKRFVSKTRQVLATSLTVSVVWNELENTPRFFICDIVDITPIKALHEELYQNNTMLEAIRINLENKVSQLEELSNIIAHNLRGPSGNIKNFADLLWAKMNKDISDVHPLDKAFSEQEAIHILKDSAEKLSGSLGTLLEIVQIKLNKDNCLSASVELNLRYARKLSERFPGVSCTVQN